MSENRIAEVGELFSIILRTNDPDVKFRSTVQMLKVIFETQKSFFVDIRALIKNKQSLKPEEIEAIQHSIESLISGVNSIQSLFDKMLEKEYKVN